MNSYSRFKGYLHSFSSFSIPKKAILLYALLILLPGCLLFFGYYRQTSAIIARDMSESMLQTIKQAEFNISNGLDNVASASDSMIANRIIFEYLSSYNKPPSEQLKHFLDLEKLVASIEQNRGIHKVRLFINPKLVYSREALHFFSLTDLDQNSAWYQTMTSRNGANYWRSTYNQAYLAEQAANVISVTRMLHDPLDFEVLIGVLSIDVKVNMIQDILERVSLTRSQEVYVVDKEQRIVSHSDSTMIGQPADLTDAHMISFAAADEGYFHEENQSTSFLFRHIPNTDWTIVAKLPTAELSGESVVLTRVSAVLVLAIGSIIFIFLLIVVFSLVAESLSKRIRDMIRYMKMAGADRFDGSLPKQKGDLRQLESTISRMVQTVHDLTAESYQSKLHERDAQLKALQAQIDPHFLYNTLDSINWMAIRRNAVEISDTIESLSTYFRLSLNKGRDVVTLTEELQLIRSYMHIHNVRNDSGIQMLYELEEQALNYYLPKLSLQPIIENAVLHGINQKRPKKGTITITARIEQAWLMIEIEDDGVGMPQHRLDQLLSSTDDGHATASYGLYNVNERVRLYSQDPSCGLTITSVLGSGTKVRLKVKAEVIQQEKDQ
jgi:two-component system sensor histidine kinase YesM